jgi:hypothetical protein
MFLPGGVPHADIEDTPVLAGDGLLAYAMVVTVRAVWTSAGARSCRDLFRGSARMYTDLPEGAAVSIKKKKKVARPSFGLCCI